MEKQLNSDLFINGTVLSDQSQSNKKELEKLPSIEESDSKLSLLSSKSIPYIPEEFLKIKMRRGVNSINVMSFFVIQFESYLIINFMNTFISFLLKSEKYYNVPQNQLGDVLGNLGLYQEITLIVVDFLVGLMIDILGRKIPILIGFLSNGWSVCASWNYITFITRLYLERFLGISQFLFVKHYGSKVLLLIDWLLSPGISSILIIWHQRCKIFIIYEVLKETCFKIRLFGPLYFEDKLQSQGYSKQGSSDVISWLIMASNLLVIPLSLLTGYTSDKYKVWINIAVNVLILLVTQVIMILPVNNPICLFVGYTLTLALYINLYLLGFTLLSKIVVQESRGTLFGAFTLVGSVGVLFINKVGGYLFDNVDSIWPFIILLICTAQLAILTFFFGLCKELKT
ncbi:major facilitator superfamily mfs_1 [Stylonychia lemnae]|uniref:Major facilitator superfamily mfs_1 n=1 Tax=Stylonychia lemnae TaxID=5949 RepID=A0A078B8J4_STYLE|nr:major facilitator superfamily mfs_1 [Stylonychia lemnae]|eukprot:CDW90729.1 major facilitator superfamily mfs_1 [Stylonychia lemnae]